MTGIVIFVVVMALAIMAGLYGYNRLLNKPDCGCAK